MAQAVSEVATPRPLPPRPPRARAVETRAHRRARANERVSAPVTGGVRDPLVRGDDHPARRVGRSSLLMGTAAAIHALVLAGFLAGNAVYRALLAEQAPEEAPTEVAVIEPAASEPPAEAPVPEPEPVAAEDLAAPAAEAVDAPVEPPAPIGLSADSLGEGGDGPAYRVGASLLGSTAAGALSQEVLAPEGKRADVRSLVMTQSSVDELPRPDPSNRAPTMPARARADGVTGQVRIELVIGASGAVEDVRVLRAEPAGVFDQSVLEVVRTWRFSPATYRGQAVRMRIAQTIRFEVG